VEGSSVHCNMLHSTELCWCTDSINIVFTLLYEVFYDCHHHLDFLKGEEFLTSGETVTV
jgi:hypothetical protein